MKILHVLGSLQQSSGGPLRGTLDLSARGFEFNLHSEIVGVGPLNVSDNPFPEAFIHSLPSGCLRSYGYCSLLRPWLRQHLRDFDGVVIHGMWQYHTWAAAEECLTSEKPYACFPHGMLEPWSFFGQGWYKAAKKFLYWQLCEAEILQKACHIFFTSQREMNLARRTFSLRPPQSLLMPSGAVLQVPTVRTPSNCEIIQPADRKVALFLGRLHPKKNIEFLISAWAKAAPPPEWHFVIAGPGDAGYLDHLACFVHQLRLDENVHFPGYVGGIDRAYLFQRADWFLLPSLQDNFGIAVLEAISNSCPVVISDQVYIGDYFDEYRGILRLDVDVWSEFIKGDMLDPNFREEAVKHLRSIGERRFSIEVIAQQWATQLKRIFSNPQPPVEADYHSSSLSARDWVKEVRRYNNYRHECPASPPHSS